MGSAERREAQVSRAGCRASGRAARPFAVGEPLLRNLRPCSQLLQVNIVTFVELNTGHDSTLQRKREREREKERENRAR